MTDELVFDKSLKSSDHGVLPDAHLRVYASLETGTYNARLWVPERASTTARCVSFCQGAILVELGEDGRFLALQLQDLPNADDDAEPFSSFVEASGEADLYWASFCTAQRAWNQCAALVARERRELARNRSRATDLWKSPPAKTERAFAAC